MTTEPLPPKEPKPPEPLKEPKPVDPKDLPPPAPMDPPVEEEVVIPNDPSQDFEPPTEITEEEMPDVPQAPASVGPDAVITVGEVKFGWQDPPIEEDKTPAMCYHIGTVAAKSQLKEHAVGHEWVCNCGTVFVVAYNSGGKKTLVQKEIADGTE